MNTQNSKEKDNKIRIVYIPHPAPFDMICDS